MSVLSKKRLLLAVASLLATSTLLANPSPRTQVKLVYEPPTGTTVLFGGMSPFDNATQLSYYSAETWVWNGLRWAQRYPAHSPSGRAAHAMVWDSARSRVVLFGGRTNATAVIDDTWVWKNGDWTQIATPASPDARNFHGMAYDPLRDRVVMFGGTVLGADQKSFITATDTWEFDGTTWREVAATGPAINKPHLVYDAARKEIIAIGFNDAGATVMYAYDGATSTWSQRSPEGLPPCGNDVALTYVESSASIILVGGACAGTYEPAYIYNGTKWEKLPATFPIGYVFGAGVAHDALRDRTIVYGGSDVASEPRAHTLTYYGADWHLEVVAVRPTPRSLSAFVTDPVTKSIWLLGGLSQHEDAYLDDLWRYQNGNWTLFPPGPDAPTNCGAVYMTFDTDRSRLVVACNGASVYELDVNALTWKKFTDLKTVPAARRFGNFVYDATLKQAVLYGGYSTDYLNDTWLWNGTAWTEVKKNRADARALASMWYDASRKRVVLYGGIGRPSFDDAVRRYSDMWELESPANGWKKITITTTTPGERYGAQTLVDPRTGRTLVFGGIRVDQISEKVRRQVYANDVWEWNGTAWARLAETTAPPARENGMIAFDPTSSKIVLFGGYAGFFFNDVWTSSDALAWQPFIESTARRRSTGR